MRRSLLVFGIALLFVPRAEADPVTLSGQGTVQSVGEFGYLLGTFSAGDPFAFDWTFNVLPLRDASPRPLFPLSCHRPSIAG